MEQWPARRPSLRVAVVTETFPPEVNGVAMTLGRMVDGLRQRNHHVQLIRPRQGVDDTAQRGPDFEEVLKAGVPIPRYDSLRMGLPAARALQRLWASARPDVVQVATEGPLGWSAVTAARRLGLPVASEFHTNFHAYSRHYGVGWLRTPIGAYLRKFHNRAQITLVPTHAMRDDLLARGWRRVQVVARGVDATLFDPQRRSTGLRAQWGATADTPVAIHVGRLAPEKNLALVFDAWHAIRQVRDDVRLVLVGDGPERAALQRAHPQAVFAGMRTGVDLATHYASGDLFLFPSVTETFGNVLMEALASGLAAVAFDYAAARQHIVHGRHGLLAPFGDAGAFKAAAVDAVRAVDRWPAIRTAARATAEAVDWERVHDDLEAVLVALAQSGQRSAAVAFSR
jgi:glycosyltransferase involved in cell wall biosynthesis